MDMNVIKEYLISLGFRINEDSLNNAKQSIQGVEGMVKNFADSNMDNMSSIQSFFKLFNSSIKDNLGIVSKIVPEAKLPLLQIVSFAELLYKAIGRVSKGFRSVNSDKLKDAQKQAKNASSGMNNLSKKSIEAQTPIIQLITLIKELNSSINNLAQNIKLNVDSDSVKNASSVVEDLNKKGNDTGKSFKQLNKNKVDSKGIKNASNAMENFSKRTAEAKTPLIQLIELVRELNIGIDRLLLSLEKIKIPSIPVKVPKMPKVKKPKEIPNTTKPIPKEQPIELPTNLPTKGMDNMVRKTNNATTALQVLKNTGGKAVEDFSKGSKIALGLVAGGFAAFAVAAVGAWKTITGLAKQDLGFQKLAMQLWTTTENAREVSMALKTMKVSMQDLWLSPELLQQFNQLRKDTAQLKLPDDAEESLKRVRSVTFEFQRLKQAGSLAFQWIGYYIAKYAAGPIAGIHQDLQAFTNWILKNIPEAAKVIGTVLGTILRLAITLIKTVYTLIKPIVEIIQFIAEELGKLPKPLQDILKLIGLIGVALMTGPLGVIFLILLALDDLFTYLKGGKSVIGGFFGEFTKGAKAINDLKAKLKAIKDAVTEPFKELKNGWDSFWGSIGQFIDNIEKKFKKFEDNVKNSPIGKLVGAIDKALPSAKSKVAGFENNSKKGASNMFSYLMPQNYNTKNSTTNATHNNSQSNTFNIYGSNANATATAVTSKLGIASRNLGGVVD
jgi:hypothetical protein